MDRRDRRTRKSVKKRPRVPIKTYKWEDVRRSKRRGGYPWTHLYKRPYEGTVDLSEFTMEELRKTRSSSDVDDKSKDGVQIKEMKSDEKLHQNGEENEGTHHHSKAELSPEPIVTQESSNEDLAQKEQEDKPNIQAVESSDSSGNISQLLDGSTANLAENNKDIPAANLPEKEQPDSSKVSDRSTRAKSEEVKRKRKLSVESSQSRKSLSKLNFIKRIKEAKEKIKIQKAREQLPRLSFSSQNIIKIKKPEKEPPPRRTPPKDLTVLFGKPPKNPVYIRIPLKPPPGEVDEFSYLEFGEKQPITKPKDSSASIDKVGEGNSKPKPSFKSLGTRVLEGNKNLETPNDSERLSRSANVSRSSSFNDKKKELASDRISGSLTRLDKAEFQVLSASPLQGSDMRIYDTGDKKTHNILPVAGDIIIAGRSTTPDNTEFRVTTYRIERAKSAEPERKRKRSIDSAHSRRSLSKLGFLKKLKSTAEKLKFPKVSLSRSSSKKAQKVEEKSKEQQPAPAKQPQTLKPGKDEKPVYIHIPLKPAPGETDEFSYLENQEDGSTSTPTPIPQTKDKELTRDESKDDSLDTPSVEGAEGGTQSAVQLIILTAPSDDEYLDDKPDVPETPSSVDSNPSLEKELKQLAEDVVDRISPQTRRKKLEPVAEGSENSSGRINLEELSDNDDGNDGKEKAQLKEANRTDDEKIQRTKNDPEPGSSSEHVTIDEEDGLKSSEIRIVELAREPEQKQDDKLQEVKSEKADNKELHHESTDKEAAAVPPKPVEEAAGKTTLKMESPVLKKKVSFKRRSRDESKDGDYEEVGGKVEEQASREVKKAAVATLGNNQSMSVDEEKTYLDQKIIKDTSLEEDYNKWSKLR